MVSAGRINLYLYENRRAACEAVPDADADAAQALARRYRRRQRGFRASCDDVCSH